MPGPAARSPTQVSLSATLLLPVCKLKKNVLPLWVGSFQNLRPLVTSRSLAPFGQRAALKGGLPVGARSRPTFRSELGGRLPLALPFRWPLGSTARSPGSRYWTSLGSGYWETGPRLAGAGNRQRGGGRTRQGAPRGARSWAHGAFNTMDRSHDHSAPPSRQPAAGASCWSSQRCLLPGVSTRPPSDLSRDDDASLPLALG